MTAAADLDRAERDIKLEILSAAKASDSARVEWIVTRWLTLPSMEVLAPGT